MLLKTLTISSKGQVSLPADVMRELRLRKGSTLLLVQKGGHMILVPAERVAKLLEDELEDFSALAAPSFQQLWENEADEVWNEA